MVYEARYGFHWRGVLLLAVGALFVAVALSPLGDGMSLVLRILVVGLFGGGALVMFLVMASRKVALRVDAKGVLLGGVPMRYRATTAFVPWEEIVRVVLWKQRVGLSSMPYVGVERRPDLPPLPGPGNGRLGRALTGSLVGHIPHHVVMASRAVNGWRLDREALSAAVAVNAPGIPIHDAS